MKRARTLPVKGLDQVQAATYIGVSVEKFRELVARKLMPKPKLLDTLRRWDVDVLDVYFNALPDDERSESERAPAARKTIRETRPEGHRWS